MGYIEKNLMENEKVIYRTQLHWVIFIGPAIIAIPFFIISLMFFFTSFAIGLLCLLLAVLIILNPLISYKTSEFAITSKRVLTKVGFIKRDSLEILLKKVEAINVKQGLIGRMFNFGTIIILGTGGTPNIFHKIDNPMQLRKFAQEQIDLQV